MGAPLRVLIVEDSEEDSALLLRELRRGGYDVSHQRVDTPAAMNSALGTQEWDVVLSDHSMPHFSGSEALSLVREKNLDLPFIFVSGTLGEETAVAALKSGAQDYLVKNNLVRLIPAIRRELREVEQRRERRRLEQQFQRSEELYRHLVEDSPDAMLVHRHGRIVFANPACATLFGASSADELLGKQQLELIHPDDRETVAQRIHRFSHDFRSVRRGETKLLRLDGEETCAEVAARTVLYQGEPASQVMFHDISQRKIAEQKLRQSEANLAAAQAIAHVGNWSWDVNDDILSWSAEMFQIYGVSPNEFDLKAAFTKSFIHPDDASRCEQYRADMLAGKSADAFDYRIIRPDGSERVVRVLGGAVTRDPAGRPLRVSGVVLDITEHKKAEERFSKAFHANPQPMVIATLAQGRYVDANESFLRVTGYRREEVIGRTFLELKFWLKPEEQTRFLDLLEKERSVRDLEIKFQTKSGEERSAMNSTEIIEIGGEKCVISIFKDITEQKQLEKQLRQAQKMEAIGQLSGGIAHDFNNLLGVIIGHSELLEEQLSEDSPQRTHCKRIMKAGQSAASLTRQLLAFSRQQVLEPRILDLNVVVRNVEKMLQRLIGEDIDLRTRMATDLGRVKADEGQIEQVILNLAVNARDAMPDGGRLTIETANVDLDEDYARRHAPQPAGPYVLLAVSDTGIGMDAATQSRIFEPFFTTKELGKGTGLGLSTVYGVVRQSGGHIWVYSEVGLGTTFKIYLPRTGGTVDAEKLTAGGTDSLQGAETVLLVEDDPSLRELTLSILAKSGYTVLEADCPEVAVEIERKHNGPIQLLLTDMVMPGMNGETLAQKLSLARPTMSVICVSGYSGFTHSKIFDADANFLPKPFTREALLRKVRDVLASSRVPKTALK